MLRPGGQLFVYTRTPEQNSRSVWGRFFPGFTRREQRLYCDATLHDALASLGPVVMRQHAFERSATLTQLAERVRGGSYSTFALYPPDENLLWPASSAPSPAPTRSPGPTRTSWCRRR